MNADDIASEFDALEELIALARQAERQLSEYERTLSLLPLSGFYNTVDQIKELVNGHN